MNKRTAEVLSVIENVVNLFSTGQYQELERLTGGVQLSAQYMRQVAEEWIYPIVPPPPGVLPSLIRDDLSALDPVAGFDPPYSDVMYISIQRKKGCLTFLRTCGLLTSPKAGTVLRLTV